MLDFTHTPPGSKADIQIFLGQNTAVTQPLSLTWLKPRGVAMVHIFMLGCGGNGATGTVGATAVGGAGGGGGAQSTWIGAAAALPDVLYLGGGLRGAGTVLNSMVAVRPHGATYNSAPLATDLILVAPGAIGNAVTAGAAGTVAAAILSGLGTSSFLVGLAGGAAGAVTPTAGGAAAAGTTGILCQGGGGGGGMSATATSAGGVCTSSFPSFAQNSPAGAGGTSGVAGRRGSPGLWAPRGLRISTGGGGGGSGFPTATASAGGPGGPGGYGSGGGGGGGGITGQTAALGGFGGQAIIIITAW